MANSLAKYHWQLLSEPAEEGPPRQLSHSPQSQSVEEQSQTSTLLFDKPAGTRTLSQFGVAKDTIVPTVVTSTHIIAVITKQFTILTKNAMLCFLSQRYCFIKTSVPDLLHRLTSGVEFRQICNTVRHTGKTRRFVIEPTGIPYVL